MAAAVLFFFSLILAAAGGGSAGRDFYVGGRDGWTTSPAEPFNRWAERNRFQVNDRLVFRYGKHGGPVLVVSQSHYDACNATEPLSRLDGGGHADFTLAKSGPYFFISGDAGRCQAGERLIVVVLAERGSDTTPPPPSPASPPPVPAPPAPAPTSPPPAPATGNTTSPPLAPPPSSTNATAPPPSPSAAAASSSGSLMLLVIGAGAILLA